MVQRYCFRRLLHRVNKTQYPVAAIDEWITMGRLDSCGSQSLIEQSIHLVAKVSLNRISAGSGLLDVERSDSSVMRQTRHQAWFHQVSSLSGHLDGLP